MAVLPPDPVFCFKADMGHIHSLCFSVTSGDYCSQLLASTEKGPVYFWDLETNRLQHQQDMGESTQAIHYANYNVITQQKSGLVKLWTVKKSSYQVMHTYEAGAGFCKSIVLGNNLLVPQEDGGVDILDIDSLTRINRVVPGKEQLGNLICLEEVKVDGKICLLGGYETGDVILWDLNTFQPCGHVKLQEHITSLTFDPATCRGVCGSDSNILQLFTVDKSYNMTLRCEVSMTNEGCNVVRMRPDGKIFVSGGWDGRLRVFSWKTLRILVVLTEHKSAITDVKFSPGTINYWKSRIMAASDADGVISLWNLYN